MVLRKASKSWLVVGNMQCNNWIIRPCEPVALSEKYPVDPTGNLGGTSSVPIWKESAGTRRIMATLRLMILVIGVAYFWVPGICSASPQEVFG